MQRRTFLTGLGTLLGGVLPEEAIPLNRVWSFPKEIKVVRDPLAIYERDANGIREAKDWLYDVDDINKLTMKYTVPVLHDNVFKTSPLIWRLRFPEGIKFDGGMS